MSQVKNILSRLVTNEKTPLVLTVVACTGVVATSVMTGRARLRAEDILDDLRAEGLGHGINRQGKERVPFKLQLKHTWKCYAPAVGVGTVTILSIVAMNRVTAKNAAILTAGATLATTTLQEYQQHVLEEIGPEKESRIRGKIAKNKFKNSDQSQVDALIISGDEVACLDEFSGRYFKSNADTLRRIENEMNRHILQGFNEAISLNDLYEEMGLPPNEVGEVVGFNLDTPVDFHFKGDLMTDTKKPVLSVGFIHHPVENFRNFT